MLRLVLSFNPCFTRESLWNSRQILLSGYRWSIGAVTRICVMHDPWLWDNHCGWPPSPQHTSVYSLSICDLMSWDEHIWDFSRIEDLFSAKVSRVIVDTPRTGPVQVHQGPWYRASNLKGPHKFLKKRGKKLVPLNKICH